MKKLGENDKRNSFNVESWIEFLILCSGLAKCSQLTATMGQTFPNPIKFPNKNKENCNTAKLKWVMFGCSKWSKSFSVCSIFSKYVNLIRNPLIGGEGEDHWFVTKPFKSISIYGVFCYKGRESLKSWKIAIHNLWTFS